MSRETALEAGAFAAAVAASALIALKPGAGDVLAPVALALVVGWIVWSDVKSFIIPDGAAAALGALALGVRLAADGLTPASALFALGGGLACGAALWAVREIYYRARGHDGLGFGDVKLAAAAGVLIGPAGFAVALLAASLAGLAIAGLRGGALRTEKLPLGALLAPAALGVWALGLDGLTG
ncbi:prepilin peptidase [Methylopila sp. M107]|uniref:prepilin peptidase n=1 Tax=Methylopila sp. M107 TaxID=1101190 RepID=UPI00037A84AD|nr:prepilin peptidase [Methylopila sp. M107]